MVKLMIFPKYLFLFRTAPLEYYPKTLAVLAEDAPQLCLAIQKAQTLAIQKAQVLLSTAKKKGGMAFLHLETYYKATTFLKYYSGSYSVTWKDIRETVFHSRTFQEITWVTSHTGQSSDQTSALNVVILKAWDQNKKVITSNHSLLQKFLGQHWFYLGEDSSSFKVWWANNLIRCYGMSLNMEDFL